LRKDTNFLDVTNNTCAYTEIPEVKIPEWYSTFGTAVGVEVSDNINFDLDANKTYDLSTRQAIPLVLLGRFIDKDSNLVQTSVEFVCITANNTVKGSRVPEQQTPWESTGTAISARIVGWVAGLVTTVIILVL
jgi:hypothetical protein